MTLWVVSPMLHDTASFLRVRDDVKAAMGDDSIRFVVVDDSAGSDREVDRLEPLDDVRVLVPPFNLGHQRAIVFGLRAIAAEVAGDDIVVTMDSDGEDQPSDVPRLVAALTDRVTLVIAERTQRSESWSFRLLYLCFRLAFRLLTGTSVRSGNFAAQRGDSLVTTIGHPSFDLCYSSTLLTLRRPMAKVPCARGIRFAGRSRMNRHALIAHGLRMMLPFGERIAVRMLVASGASAVASVAGSVLVASGVLGEDRALGWLAIAALGAVSTVGLVCFVVLFSDSSRSSTPAP